jgi:phosphoglycolate phosphatase-like HAD superfamily hydrolase
MTNNRTNNGLIVEKISTRDSVIIKLMKKTRLVLFDWNGTFVDDEKQTVRALRAILEGVGHESSQLSEDKLIKLHRDTFEIPLSKMHRAIGLSPEQSELARKNLFWKNSYEKSENKIKMHAGITEAIKLINSKDAKFGILSNHTLVGIERLLKGFGFANVLILANENDRQAHHQGKLHRIKKYLSDNENTVVSAVIGDSPEEIEIAREIKAKSVIFSNGWVSNERLKPFHPDFLIDSSELPKVLESILS